MAQQLPSFSVKDKLLDKINKTTCRCHLYTQKEIDEFMKEDVISEELRKELKKIISS